LIDILPLTVWVYLHSIFWVSSVKRFSHKSAFRTPKVIQGHRFWYQSKARMCDFLLVRHSNLGPILHRFVDISGFALMTPPLFHPTLALGCSCWTRSPMLGSART